MTSGRAARARFSWHVASALIVGAALSMTWAVPASAVTPVGAVTIPAQGGNNKVSVPSGTTIFAGYDFGLVAGATTEFTNAQVVLDVSCATAGVTPSQSSVTVNIPDETYVDNNTNSNGFVPSGNQADPAVYQGSITMPNLCAGGNMVIGNPNMGPFTANVWSTDSTTSINVRFHYGVASDLSTGGGTGSSWSATKAVIPADIAGVPIAPLLGRWAIAGVAAAFLMGAGAVVWRRSRRPALVELDLGR